MKKAAQLPSLLEAYPRGTEFIYPFVAVDDTYGLFYFCVASKKAIQHQELRGYMDEAKKLIDDHGSPGLGMWHERMIERGFRPLPSTISVFGNETVTLDCLPKLNLEER